MLDLRPNILLVNMCCNYEKGSEWAVGWDFLLELSKTNNLYVITADEDRASIEDKKHLLNDNVHFYYIPVGWNNRRYVNAIFRQFEFDKMLEAWHQSALKLAKLIVKQNKIDLVHKLTPCGFRSPGSYWRLGTPSVLGPVTGMTEIPTNLIFRDIPFFEALKLLAKRFFAPFDFRFKKNIRYAFKNYSVVIAGSTYLQTELLKVWKRDVPMVIQSGLPENFQCINKPEKRLQRQALNIIWVGKMEPRKNLHLVLKGLAMLPSEIQWHLHVVGGGEMLNDWKKLCLSLNLSRHVTFYGKVPREEVFEVMRKGHVFVTLSALDSAPGVVFEAYGCGLPVISLDISGFSDIVKSSTGFRIPTNTKNMIYYDLAQKIEYLYINENDRFNMAKNAIIEAKRSYYDSKVAIFNQIYQNLLKVR